MPEKEINIEELKVRLSYAESLNDTLELVINGADMPVLLLDNSGNILMCNNAFARVVKHGKEDVEEKQLIEVLHENAADNIVSMVSRSALDNKTVAFEETLRERVFLGSISPAGPDRAVIIMQDVTDLRAAEREAIERESKIRNHQRALIKLTTDKFLLEDDISEGMKTAMEVASDTLEVERAGVWLLGNDNSILECVELFERSAGRHSSGSILAAHDYPEYFKAVKSQRAVDAHDAISDPRTSEFAEEYLEPLGIKSMLDAAIRRKGDIIGVVCFEHIGPTRMWTAEEKTFAGQIGDFINNLLISHDHREAERALRDNEERLELALQATRLATWDWNLETGAVRFDNRLMEMLGYSGDTLPSDRQYEKWMEFVHPDDLREMVETMQKHLAGELDVYETVYRARAADGTWRWIHDRGRIVERDNTGNPVRVAGTNQDITERKKREELFELTQFAIDRASDSFLWIDNKGRLLYVNDTACRTLGYSREELLKLRIYDIDMGFPEDGWEKSWLRLKNHGSMVAYSRYKTSDGIIFPVEITGNFIEYLGREQVFAFVRDISDRKLAEEALRESEEKYRKLVENSPLPILIHCGGKIVFANIEATRVLAGDSVGKLTGRDLLDIIPEEHHELVMERMRTVYGGGKLTKPVEHQHVRLDGEVIDVEVVTTPVEFEGKPAAQVVFSDITEKKRAERELQKAQALLTAAVEQTPAGILIADAPDVTIRLANPAALHIRGESKESLTDIPVDKHQQEWSVFHPDGTPMNGEDLPLSRAIQRGEVTRNQEVIIRRPDGEERWILGNAAPVKDRDGNVIAAVVVFPDITERKKTEKELENYRHRLEDLVQERTRELESAQEKLIESERLAALGQFSGSVAHEIRNPLAVISNAVFFLKKKAAGFDDEKFSYYLGKIEKQVERTSEIINSIMRLTRTDLPVLDRVELNAFVRDNISLLEIPDNIQLEIDTSEADIHADLDQEQFFIVFENIVKNAVQAMENGGSLYVGVRMPDVNDNRMAEIVFRDNGEGIEKEYLKKIFSPMFTTKNYGIGFGLSIVRLIIEKHHGTIEADSEPGAGTKFTIKIPAVN